MNHIEAMKLALDALQGSGYYDTKQQREAITALRQAIQEAALQQLTDIHQEMEQKPVAWWNPDESGLAFQKLRGDWQPLYAAPVHTIDINQRCVDETSKYEHEPVAEIVCEDMGRPFNAMKIRTHFFKEVPAVGTKLYTASPKQEPNVYGDGNVYRGVRSKDSQTKTLYHTAPPRREWVWLTDAEIFDVIRSLCADNETAEMLIDISMDEYRAIEAKLKEKNT